ncbi:MAG: DUF2892 domain-containing protein [Betaproteobacteria bacterium]|jgi:hypothetical protein|nr:DUF2892 domain-containing protein [Betaproteobacteria bacterium]
MLKKNMGGSDRAVRFILGCLLVISAAVGALGPWAYLGVMAMITGAIGNCPVYGVFGYSTNKSSKSKLLL